MTYLKSTKTIRFHKQVSEMIQSLDISSRVNLSNIFALLSHGEFLGMPISRPMPVMGSGIYELRIHDKSGQHRIFYYTKHEKAILVFHMFKKKTRTTPKHEIQIGLRRLKKML